MRMAPLVERVDQRGTPHKRLRLAEAWRSTCTHRLLQRAAGAPHDFGKARLVHPGGPQLSVVPCEHCCGAAWEIEKMPLLNLHSKSPVVGPDPKHSSTGSKA